MGFQNPHVGFAEVLSGGQQFDVPNAYTNLVQDLNKIIQATGQNLTSTGVQDWSAFYKQLHTLSPNIGKILRDSVNFFAVKDPARHASNLTLTQALGSQAAVGKLIRDLDNYIASAEVIADPIAEQSLTMARLVREYMADEVTISRVSSQASSKTTAQLQNDFRNLRNGQQLADYIDSHNSLYETMRFIVDRYKPGTFQRQVAEFMLNHAAVKDVQIIIAPKMAMGNSAGRYVPASGVILIREGMSIDKMVGTIMHEATHAYTTRMSLRYKHWKHELLTDPNSQPKDFGLSDNEVRFLSKTEEILNIVRNAPISKTDAQRFNGMTIAANNVPYGVSFNTDSSVDIAEFLAELYSDANFRQWVEEEITRRQQVNKKTARGWLFDIVDSFLSLFGIKTTNKALEQFLEKGFTYFDSEHWVSSAPGIYKQLSGKHVSYLDRSMGTHNDKDMRSRAQEDEENGVRYYTFKRNNAFGKPELAGSAKYDENTGSWEIQFADQDGNVTIQRDLTIDEAMKLALANDLAVFSRSNENGLSHYLTDQIEKLRMTHPRLANALERLRFFLMNYFDEGRVNDAIGRIYEFALSAEQYLANRDALLTWLERAARAQGKDPASAQRFINDIQAKTQTFLNERGLDEKTFYDHKVAVIEAAKQHGFTVEQLNDTIYALTAKHRKALFDKDPGEINPYTGQAYRDGAMVSGFEYKDANGNIVKDDDGSKYLSSLPPEKARFIPQLERMWTDMNNSVLDFEYQAGAISKDQYYSMYGLFYAPLRNVDDAASAFYKRAMGRHTKAKDPATAYFEFVNARVMYAQHQMKMQYLVDMALTQNVQNVLTVNEVNFVQSGDQLKKVWRRANLQDPATIAVWRGDRQYIMKITDDHIANIMRKSHARQMTGMWQAISSVTRALSAVRTSLSPTFVPAAFARDILTAMGNVQSAFRDAGQYKLTDEEARQIAPLVAKRSVAAAVSILRGNATGTRDWQYDVFKRAGGGITMNARFDFEQANDWLKSGLALNGTGQRRLGDGLKGVKKGVGKAMEISHAFEDAVRFATFMEFVKLRNGGREFQTEQEMINFLQQNPEIKSSAVTGSKNVTGNFEVKGSNIGWRSFYMFFNATMVGLSSAVNMFDPRHGKHGLHYGGLLLGLMLASMALTDADLGDDEDGKSKVSRIGKMGDSLCYGGVCIPLPHEYRGVTNLGAAMYNLVSGDYTMGQAISQSMHGILQMGSPWTFDGFSTSGNQMHTLLQNLTPTLGELPLQLATGYNSFGNQIVPEYAYTANGQRIMNAMDWQKTKMSDPQWTKWIAMNGQKFLGLDVSSSEIDHTMQFILGSIYTSMKKAYSAYEEGGSVVDIAYEFAGRGFSMPYDNRAMISEAKERIRELKAQLSMGEDTTNMLRSSDEMKADPNYAKLIALEKYIEKQEKALTFNGKSYAELYRQKQEGILTGNTDLILEANEGLDVLNEERRQVWAQFWDAHDDITGGYK